MRINITKITTLYKTSEWFYYGIFALIFVNLMINQRYDILVNGTIKNNWVYFLFVVLFRFRFLV